MHTLTTPPAFDWPADVLSFADDAGLRPALEPMREATARLVPTMTALRVFVEPDPELPDWLYLVFEATIPPTDAADRQATRAAWSAELRRLCPTPVGREVIAALVQGGA